MASHASATQSALPPVLLTDKQAAELMGIGTTLFHSLRCSEWFPPAVQLAPRIVRWSRSEIEAAIPRMPRIIKPSEPEQLRRGRIERMKAGGAA